MRREDTSAVGGMIGTVLLLVLIVALGLWNVATCARWGTRTVMETSCYTTSSGYTSCSTYPSEETYCVERKR